MATYVSKEKMKDKKEKDKEFYKEFKGLMEDKNSSPEIMKKLNISLGKYFKFYEKYVAELKAKREEAKIKHQNVQNGRTDFISRICGIR